MSPEDLAFLATAARARAGLMLGPDRAYFAESRLASLARAEGLASVEELVARLRDDPGQPLMRTVVEALGTPETSFFRDRVPFHRLRDEVLPALASRRPGGRVRIWSAGCSTGQEAYSLAMIAEEAGAALSGVEIVATDLSARALEKAQGGLYSQFEVQRGLPIRMLLRHFEKVDDNWRVSPRLRQRIRWGRMNLVNDIAKLGRFDIVLCRNVLSYFDPAPAQLVLLRLADVLAEDGCLMMGEDEGLGLPDPFEPAEGGAGFFRRNPDLVRAA